MPFPPPLGVALGEGEGDVECVGVGLGEPGVTVPVQVTPLKLIALGTEFVPEYEPLKPKLTEAFVPTEPLYVALVTVTDWPDWLTVPFHSWVTCWLPGKVQATFQELTALPRLVIETLAPKPAFHWLVTEYVA